MRVGVRNGIADGVGCGWLLGRLRSVGKLYVGLEVRAVVRAVVSVALSVMLFCSSDSSTLKTAPSVTIPMRAGRVYESLITGDQSEEYSKPQM